jgi:hypothetical protein
MQNCLVSPLAGGVSMSMGDGFPCMVSPVKRKNATVIALLDKFNVLLERVLPSDKESADSKSASGSTSRLCDLFHDTFSKAFTGKEFSLLVGDEGSSSEMGWHDVHTTKDELKDIFCDIHSLHLPSQEMKIAKIVKKNANTDVTVEVQLVDKVSEQETEKKPKKEKEVMTEKSLPPPPVSVSTPTAMSISSSFMPKPPTSLSMPMPPAPAPTSTRAPKTITIPTALPLPKPSGLRAPKNKGLSTRPSHQSNIRLQDENRFHITGSKPRSMTGSGSGAGSSRVPTQALQLKLPPKMNLKQPLQRGNTNNGSVLETNNTVL